MKSHIFQAVVGLFVLALVTGYSLFSCSDDDDASLENGNTEDDDDFLQDDDNRDDVSLDDDDNDNNIDDDNDNDTTPADDDDTPDQDCISAYEKIFECNPEGLGEYPLDVWIDFYCYGNEDAVFGTSGGVVQCYLEYPDNCSAYATCIENVLHPPVADEDCVAAFESYYDCWPTGFFPYSEEQMIKAHCYGSDDPIYGPGGGLVQCYLEFGDVCVDYVYCVFHLFHKQSLLREHDTDENA